jgi:hypothetical protein
VVQRLVLGADVPRVGMRRQRLNALAFDRQHQTAAVLDEARLPIRVTQQSRQVIHVSLELSEVCHNSSTSLPGSSDNAMIFMTQ